MVHENVSAFSFVLTQLNDMLKWALQAETDRPKPPLPSKGSLVKKKSNNVTSVNKVVTFTETSFINEDAPSVKKAFTFTETSFLSENADDSSEDSAEEEVRVC